MPAPSNSAQDTAIKQSFQSVSTAVTTSASTTKTLLKKQSILLRKSLLQTTNAVDFTDSFIDNVNKVLFAGIVSSGTGGPKGSVAVVRKKDPTIERCISFIAAFVAHLQQQSESTDGQAVSVFTNALLAYLGGCGDTEFVLMEHHDKTVRVRVCQLLASCIDCVDEIESEIYAQLRERLLVRIRDKESAVRLHAAIALSKFQEDCDEEEAAEMDQVVTALISLLRTDSSSDVRRAVLCNLDPTPQTIPFIIERIRDVDYRIRRYIYKKFLPLNDETGEMRDLRQFSIADRQQIIAWGLNDRHAAVKEACEDLVVSYWIVQSGDVLGFLERLDVGSGEEVAANALNVYFKRAFQAKNGGAEFKQWLLTLFGDAAFWTDLTPERAFFARCLCEHVKQDENVVDEEVDDAVVPQLSLHASRVQAYFNKLSVVASSRNQDIDDDEQDAQLTLLEFVCRQLLFICPTLDMADEAGRRNLHRLLVSILDNAHNDALFADPAGLVRCVVDVLRKVGGSGDAGAFEEDLMRIARVACEKAETIMENDVDELAEKMTALELNKFDRKRRVFKLKALAVVSVLLQNSARLLTPELMAFLHETCIPALSASDDPSLQLPALFCFTQFSLADLDLAKQHFAVFLQMIESDSEEVTELALKAVFDLLLLYGLSTFISEDLSRKKIIKKLGSLVEDYERPEVQNVAVTGFAKVLARPNTCNADGDVEEGNFDAKVLDALLTVYFDPQSARRDSLRQCLAYFFHHFAATTGITNNERLAEAFSRVFFDIVDLQDDEGGVGAIQIAMQFIEWIGTNADMAALTDLYLIAGTGLCRTAMAQSSPAVWKLCAQVISRVHLVAPCSEEKLEELGEAVEDLSGVVRDKATLGVLERVKEVIRGVLVCSGAQSEQDDEGDDGEGDEDDDDDLDEDEE